MRELKNIKLVIAYDGTNYFGWQKQQNKRTIQGIIENTISRITGDLKVKVNGSGRTDAGVHALAQVGNFFTDSSIPTDKWKFILNHQLPKDIRIKYAKEVGMKFHARYSAKSKFYQYLVMNRNYGESVFSAKHIFLRNYYYFVNKQLDIEKMRKVADYLVGYHDFTALSCFNQKENQPTKNKIRNIKRIGITKKDQFICFNFEANAFLYKMIRIIVGTLIDFSINNRKPEDILELLKNGDNQKAGEVIPPNGLYLIKVRYR